MTNRRSGFFVCAFLVVVALLSTQACRKKRDVFSYPYVSSLGALSDDAFGLVITASVEGYIEPCGCTSDPLGGIARFATIFTDLKTALNNRIALVDAGNLLFDAPTRIDADRCQDEKRIEVLLTTLSSLGLKSTIVGTLDNARGQEFRDAVYKAHGITPVKSGVQLINTPAGMIGVVSVSSADDNTLDKVKLAARKKESGIVAIIVLSQLPVLETKALFANRTDIDIVVQGQTASMMPLASTRLGENGPWLFEGGRQGQFFSMVLLQNLTKRGDAPLMLDTRFAERGNRIALLTARIDTLQKQAASAPKTRKDFLLSMVDKAKNEIELVEKSPPPTSLSEPHFVFHQIAITKKIDSEPKAKARLDDYEKAIPALVKKCEATMTCPTAGPGEARFVGVEVCKSCHQQAYDVWKNAVFDSVGKDDNGNEIHRRVGHSKAWKTLVDDKKDADRSCVGCHSIGFMEKGGYCRALEVDFRKDVQCESCHGAGSLHAQSGDKQFIKRKVEEATCRGCHQVPHIASPESFNYNDKVIKILGKGHGENLLKELTHQAKE